jgi:TPR repeat protein
MQMAVEQNMPAAHYFLGNFYRDGTWVDADAGKAFECYWKAAELDNSDGIERLGECYAFGVGVEQDETTAFSCFHRSAEMRNPKGELHLGLCYLKGIACNQDTQIAFQWISRAAGSGHPAVMLHLQQLGLDFEKLTGGYKHHCQQHAIATGKRFGENFDQIFNNRGKNFFPIPPGEKLGEF